MAKASKAAAYRCSECGAPSLRWSGRCTRCGEFGTVIADTPSPAAGAATSPVRSARRLAEINLTEQQRVHTGLGEFNRVIGGGLVPGQVVLLAGEPGVGKSTLLLAVAHALGQANKSVLYLSGEESTSQLGIRADRIGATSTNILIADDHDLPTVLGHIEAQRPDIVMIDSVQTLSSPQADGRPGGVAQVLECTGALVRVAKTLGVPMLLVGQSTKENSIAGPRALEHLVDTVLTFEGDPHTSLRLLRSVKNRFGAADEVVCFEQTASGLQEVPDPSGLFRSLRDAPVPGTCLTVIVEGRRPLLAEIQSLVTPMTAAAPRRAVTGLDSGRVATLVAVVSTHTKVGLTQKDVYCATVGGVRISEPAADLALCLAIASSANQVPVAGDLAAIGEIALSGDIRPTPMLAERVAEAARLGYRTIVVGPTRQKLPTLPGARIVSISHLSQAWQFLGKRAANG